MRKLVCTIMILFTCFSESVVLATTVYPAVGGQWNYGEGHHRFLFRLYAWSKNSYGHG